MTCRWGDHAQDCADHDRCSVYATSYTYADDGVWCCRDCDHLAVECECWHRCGRDDAEAAEEARQFRDAALVDAERHAAFVMWGMR